MSSSSGPGADFQWPWQYNFPPFFTIQPNDDTREKQMEAWRQLVLNWCRAHKIERLDVLESLDKPPFSNPAIDRKLSETGIRDILDDLAKRGHVEWLDKTKNGCLLMWRTPSEWANLIAKWAANTGHTGSVCTFFELLEGETGQGEDFHGMDEVLFEKALRELEKQNKAQVFDSDGAKGVKFL